MKIDHITFLLTMPFALLIILHWLFFIPFAILWLIAFGYDIHEEFQEPEHIESVYKLVEDKKTYKPKYHRGIIYHRAKQKPDGTYENIDPWSSKQEGCIITIIISLIIPLSGLSYYLIN